VTDAISKIEHRDAPAKLDRDWAVAWRRAGKKFAKCGIEPDPATRAAAVVLELWSRGAGPFTGEITRRELQDWLSEFYTGRCGAKLAVDGRVMAWALLNQK
jgi:hypothetical protein